MHLSALRVARRGPCALGSHHGACGSALSPKNHRSKVARRSPNPQMLVRAGAPHTRKPVGRDEGGAVLAPCASGAAHTQANDAARTRAGDKRRGRTVAWGHRRRGPSAFGVAQVREDGVCLACEPRLNERDTLGGSVGLACGQSSGSHLRRGWEAFLGNLAATLVHVRFPIKMCSLRPRAPTRPPSGGPTRPLFIAP